MTLWNLRDLYVDENLLSFTDIQIELVVRDDSNTLTYDIGKVSFCESIIHFLLGRQDNVH
jgi:hypothetical protein